MTIKRMAYVCLAVLLWMSTALTEHTYATGEGDCAGIKVGQKVYWDGSLLKVGQIGVLKILNDTPTYKFVNGQPKQEKTLKKGSTYRIYTFKKDYLGVGGGLYVKRDERVNYQTPSKAKLKTLACTAPRAATVPPTSTAPAPAAPTAGKCEGIEIGQKIYWEGRLLKPGQIGQLTILNDTPTYKFVNGQPKQETMLKKGNGYRIYTFKKDYLGVGGGLYVKRDERVSYKTPSKTKLNALACTVPAKDTDVEAPDKGTPKPDDPVVPVKPPVKPEDLGPQIFNQSTMASKAGMDQAGNAYLYVIIHGTPTALAVVDINKNEIFALHALNSSTSAWAIDVDRDGIVWIGGTSSGTLYSYNPNTDQLTNHGNMLAGSSDTSIQDLVAGQSHIFGGSVYGANIFGFNKGTMSRDRFEGASAGDQFAKSVALDEANQTLYVGSGPTAKLVKVDLNSNQKTYLPNDAYQTESYIDEMMVYDRYLVTKYYPSKRTNVFDTVNQTYLNEFSVDSREFSPRIPETNEFFYTAKGEFYAYHLENGSIRNTNATIPGKKNALSMDIVQLKKAPGEKWLTGLIDNKGNYFLYNPATNKVNIQTIQVPFQPVDLHLLFANPDRRFIYSNGFMTGGLTQYDTVTKDKIQLKGISQLESAEFANEKLYVGAYPNARLLELDTNQSWEEVTPKVLVSLKQFEQERITGLAVQNGHIYAGTYPQTSTKGGLILDYDLATGKYEIHQDYIPDQSIITLLADGEWIYGGTSVHANYNKAKDGAKMFRFRADNPSVKEILPLPNRASLVMSLLKGPGGEIFGAADGAVFAYNPANGKFRVSSKLVPAISGRFSNAKMILGQNGYIYGVVEGRLFKLNPTDLTYTFLLTSGAYDIAEDVYGNIYYRNSANLYMIPNTQR